MSGIKAWYGTHGDSEMEQATLGATGKPGLDGWPTRITLREGLDE